MTVPNTRHAPAYPLFLALAVAAPAGAATVVDDGGFTTWTVEESTNGPSHEVLDSGGNPGSHLSVEFTQTASSLSMFSPLPYDLSTGPLASLSFSADVLGVASGTPLGSPVGYFSFAVYQDSTLFVAPLQVFDNTDWAEVSSGPLSATDFQDPVNLTNPDFSAGGGDIRFGFTAGTVTASSAEYGIDNFTADVSPVPIPGAVWLLASALLPLAWGKRRA